MATHAHTIPAVTPRRSPGPVSPMPVTLAPIVPTPVIRPTRREMWAAYRRNGDPIPANLRGGFFQGWVA